MKGQLLLATESVATDSSEKEKSWNTNTCETDDADGKDEDLKHLDWEKGSKYCHKYYTTIAQLRL